jgi:hypothetical protein
MKTGGGENGQRMRYGAQGSDSLAGEARVALGGGGSRRRGCSPTSVWKEEEEAGWPEWVEKAKQAGWRLGQNLKRISFPNKKNWIIEYTKSLEICTRRFRGKF